MIEISVVIPVYGCREAIPELYSRLSTSLSAITKEYEIIMVDDSCPQNSWEDIRKICSDDNKVHGVRLTRNFGQHKALKAGIDRAKGNYVVLMDCDLQDRPEDIEKFYRKAEEGYDVVVKKRISRTEGHLTIFFSKLFYKVFNYFTEGSYDGELCNFCMISRKVVDEFRKFKEQSFDCLMLISWLGYNTATIEMDDDPRYHGKSSYSFARKLRMAFELITEHSNRPLLFAIKLGGIVSIASMLYIIYVLVRHFALNDLNMGWSSLIASMYLIGGVVLSAIGMAGIYIGNIFNEAKGRPVYVVQDELNGTETE